MASRSSLASSTAPLPSGPLADGQAEQEARLAQSRAQGLAGSQSDSSRASLVRRFILSE